MGGGLFTVAVAMAEAQHPMRGRWRRTDGDDNLKMPTHERLGSIATAKASAKELTGQGAAANEPGRDETVTLEHARALIS